MRLALCVTLLAIVGLALHVTLAIPSCASLGLGAHELAAAHGRVDESNIVYVNGSTPGHKIAFLRTTNNEVFRLSNGGSTFEPINDKLLTFAERSTSETDNSVYRFGVRAVFTDAGGTSLYLFGVDGKIWVSTDAGETFTFYEKLYGGVGDVPHWHAFFPHPTTPNTFAVVFDTPCCWGAMSTCPTCHRGIMWTSNDFQDVKVESLNVAYTTFTAASTVWLSHNPYALWWLEFPPIGANTDVRSFEIDARFNANLLPRLVAVDDIRVSNASYANLSFVSRMLYVESEFIGFSTQPTFRMVVSLDDGRTFRQAQLPTPPGAPAELRIDRGYVAAFGDGLLFFHYLCTSQTACTSTEREYSWDTWVSDDSDPGRFHWIAQQIVSQGRALDLDNVGGMKGAYLANKYATRNWSDDRIYSQITFNGGATWTDLAISPASHSYTCPSPKCRLILLSQSSGAHILSERYQPGFIIANGVVGEYLDLEGMLGNPNTFMSFDGGVTWQELFDLANDTDEGYHYFEVAAEGSVVAFVSGYVNTNVLTFSINGGRSFQSCTFASDTDLRYPVALFADKEGNTPNLILATIAPADVSQPSPPTTLFTFNFTSMFTRSCIESDYTTFTMTGPEGQCLLGEKKTYKVKKTDANCLGATESGKLVNTELCNCTIHDYGCHHCFYYNSTTKSCEWGGGRCVSATVPAAPVGCYFPSTYIVPLSGYRKEGNSKCLGEFEGYPVNVTQRVVTCPPNDSAVTPPSYAYVWLVYYITAALLVFVIGAAVAGYFVYVRRLRRNQTQTTDGSAPAPAPAHGATSSKWCFGPSRRRVDPDDEADDVVL